MADYQRSNIRVSDTEREDALGKLGQHLSEGRLDIDEFGERTAKVTAAKTRGELLDLFDDLPEPRPAFGRPGPPPVTRAAAPRPVRTGPGVAQVLAGVAAVALVIGLVAWIKVFPLVFMLPFIFFFVSGARWRHGHGPHGR
ncbi:DUF1707 SHOCT-like domain-containing protein [Actinophytocola gossypii]|uniref:DUF1707 domain-containing protein n=1 Tax=Actinophytocola gossypii TaxID=2812003 RepID=A0ABT2JEI9_9PSEU|nr:DUF1707 domain-containing protein [Actinophytocola gossypii]MCT2586186.1 DUF1707 domain-containing protein [Actinophytocola gossypii]